MNDTRRRWLLPAWIASLALAAAAAYYAGSRGAAAPEKDLASVRELLAASRTRADELRVQLLQEHLGLLTRAVIAGDAAALDQARKGLVELGPAAVGPSRELAIKSAADPVKRELIAVLAQIRSPEAVEALADLYLALPAERRVVKQEAASALARMGLRPVAAALGRLVREEKDPGLREVVAKLYAPYAGADPRGVAVDKAAAERGNVQGALYQELQGLDPANDAQFARLDAIARSAESTAVRVRAIQKLAERKDERCVPILAAVARAPGADDGGVVRTNALVALCGRPESSAVLACAELIEGPDSALRLAAISVLLGKDRAEYLPTLKRVRDGERYTAEERRRAAEAVARLEKP